MCATGSTHGRTSSSWRPSSCSATSRSWSAALDKTGKAAQQRRQGGAARDRPCSRRFTRRCATGGLARAVERSADDAPLLRELALRERPAGPLRAQHRRRQAAARLAARRLRGAGRAAGATRWSPSPRASRPSSPSSTPDEAAVFRAELGGAEPAARRLHPRRLRACSATSRFFTGDFRSSESRAWQLPRGWTAKQAAGRIHSDIEHGFVRAEVVPVEDLIELRLVPRRAARRACCASRARTTSSRTAT